MKSKIQNVISPWLLLTLVLFAASAVLAQTPVDDDGKPLGPVYSDAEDADFDDAESEVELLSAAELEVLIGPIALYPDDLLAIVLPASTFPLEVVQAARYLEQLKGDSSLQPDAEWDDSVVALLNYPEVLSMMSDDIDWTWRLGEAVVAQQGDVVAAVESFRDRAYAAGNLKSDDRQTVSRNVDDVIEIDPVEDDVIYVPYYEPERVVVYQTRPAYHYYPRAYPVYYYPYPAGHHFYSGGFWGVTTAFRIGWFSDHLHVYHHSYHGHPYFGRNYYGSYWRRPSVHVFNTWYGSWGYRNVNDRHRYGSYWRPRRHGGARPGSHRDRDRYYSRRQRSNSEDGYANPDRRDQRFDGRRRSRVSSSEARIQRPKVVGNDARNGGRTAQPANRDNADRASGRRPATANRRATRAEDRGDIRFRDRGNRTANGTPRRSPATAPGAAAETVSRTRTDRPATGGPANVRRNDAAQSRAGTASRRQAAERGDSRRGTVAAPARAVPNQRVREPQRRAPVREANRRSSEAPVRRAPTVRAAPQPRAAPASPARRSGAAQSQRRAPVREVNRRSSEAPVRRAPTVRAAPQPRAAPASPARRSGTAQSQRRAPVREVNRRRSEAPARRAPTARATTPAGPPRRQAASQPSRPAARAPAPQRSVAERPSANQRRDSGPQRRSNGRHNRD